MTKTLFLFFRDKKKKVAWLPAPRHPQILRLVSKPRRFPAGLGMVR